MTITMFYVFAISAVFLLWQCLSIIRTLHLHPLHNLPCPKTWITFPILRYISLARGRLDIDMRAFHNKYGEAVRFGHDQVSFITVQAWKDIYSHGHGDQQLPKVRHSTSNPSDIISATNTDHSCFRRALLSGVTYWLLRTPDALRKVTHEIRSSIKSDADITFQTTYNLPRMLACLTEALRIYPPAPVGLERITLPPNPVNISGYMIPPGKKVSGHQFAAYRSPLNFHRASEYLPERWLPCAKEDPSSPFYHDDRDVLQPFSVGPRNCIGRNLANAEMRLILARVLWKFDLELFPESATGWEEQRSFMLWERSC